MTETQYNRQPVRFIEIEQPRCSLRWGLAPCQAGMGASDTSDMSVNFATIGVASDYLAVNAAITATTGGINFAATTTNPVIRIPGTATNTFSGDDFRYVVIHGKWNDGSLAEWSATWYNTDGFAPGIGTQSIGTVYNSSYIEIDKDNIADGTEFIAVWDMADSTSYAAQWLGRTIDGLRIDFANGSDADIDIYSIQIAKDDPVNSRPKCYNTFWTCGNTPNYTPNGKIKWRFYDGRNGDPFLFALEPDANNIATNAFPVLRSASTIPSRINVGGQSSNESPFGRRAKLTFTCNEFDFDDHVGDYYTLDRTVKVAGFWAKFMARNPYYPNMIVRDYQGYQGQALGDMVMREYVLDNIEQDEKSVTITARDPLDLASDKKAQFPRASQIQLVNTLFDTGTTVKVLCVETELSDDYGNTGSTRYIRFGSEIIRYTGWTGTAPDFELTGVQRGVLGTVADDHSPGDSGQRVGRYENIRMYRVARDLLENHTTIPSAFYDFAQWETEGGTWLPTLVTTATIPEPTAVETLLGELSRDGLFYIWWDERNQVIPLAAIRPPLGTPDVWSDDLNIISGSFSERAESDDYLTRVVVFYGRKDPTESLDDEPNYRVQSIRIDADLESDDATGGAVRERKIFSRWIGTTGNALLVSAQIMLQYKFIPRYLKIDIDAKDRAAGIGTVIDLDTRHKVDTEGNRLLARYQIIEFEETDPGSKARVEMQSFQFVGKFAIIMANDAPQYADATETERLTGCWLADETTGLMPDGSAPNLLQ